MPTVVIMDKWKNALRKEFFSVVERLSSGSDYYGFKIGSVYTVGLFAELLKEKYQVHIVYITRSLINNALGYQNLVRSTRDKNFPFAHALRDVSQSSFHLSLSMRSGNSPMSITTFEDLRNDPGGESGRIAKDIGIPMDADKTNSVKEFVEADLHTWKKQGNNAVYGVHGLKK